jgi:2-polyprenyl-6-methoxyphenol hydroxylase-like FAD-dependent oxidoreductase
VPSKALIVGAGIAGPVLSIALRRAGFDTELYEARSATHEEPGAFLTLAPNGVNALRALGLDDLLNRAGGFITYGIDFYNRRGRRIGELDGTNDPELYGAGSVTLKKARLSAVLRREAIRTGVALRFDKRLEGLEPLPSGVRAIFGDGTASDGDLLVGSDGLHSRTRELLVPDWPRPKYAGFTDCTGFSSLPLNGPRIQHMTFGRRAFFGYVVDPSNEVYWRSSFAWPREPTPEERGTRTQKGWLVHLGDVHRRDPMPIPAILRATSAPIGLYGLYELTFLSTWHGDRVCLVGDAAHATPLYRAQGASLALEDAVYLAKCLRDAPTPARAFAVYQAQRKERVDRLSREGVRLADREPRNPLTSVLRAWTLPRTLKAARASSAVTYSYRIDWDERAV